MLWELCEAQLGGMGGGGGMAPGSLPRPVQWGRGGQQSQGDMLAASPG